jgi:hypothetical protein
MSSDQYDGKANTKLGKLGLQREPVGARQSYVQDDASKAARPRASMNSPRPVGTRFQTDARRTDSSSSMTWTIALSLTL